MVVKKKLFIIDIDGVVCNSTKRFSKHLRLDLKGVDYIGYRKSYFEASLTTEEDEVIELGKLIIESLVREMKPDVVLWLTAREYLAHEPTLKWLEENISLGKFVKNIVLRTRRESKIEDARVEAAIFKGAVVDELLEEYEIILAIDDEPANVEMYRSKGINAIAFRFPGINCDTSSWAIEKEK